MLAALLVGMTHTTQSEENQTGAIQLGSAAATLVASTELLGFAPSFREIARAEAFVTSFSNTTQALIAMREAVRKLELEAGTPGVDLDTSVSDALWEASRDVAAAEAGQL